MAHERIPKIRRAAIGANVTAGCLVAVAIFLMANYLGYRHHKRYDWTSSNYFSLSDKTVGVMKDLSKPVKAYVFYPPYSPTYDDIRELLTRYAEITKNLTVEYVDPEKDPARVKFLLAKFKIPPTDRAPSIVVFEQGEKTKYVYDKDVVDMDYNGARRGQAPTVKAFKGEQAFTSAILNLVQEKQPVVYAVTKHGESSLDDAGERGLEVCRTLMERENLKVEKLSLYEKRGIPEDCGLLLIVGPAEPYMDEEKKALAGYLEKGGRLFVALDPQTNSGLEPFLRGWDVEVGNNIVVDPESAQRLVFLSPLNLLADNYGSHQITDQMKGRATFYAEARSVKPGTSNPQLTARTLVQTSPSGWGETDFTNETFRYDEKKDLKGPVSFGVAVEANAEKAGDAPLKNVRLVVMGDSDFIANAKITTMGNATLFLNIVNWLTSREKLIAIGPKMPEQTRVRLNRAQLINTFYMFGALPVMGLLLGIVIWWRRRK
ncbi:MAG: GldG family protein [Chlamydiota bacterium]